MELSVTINGERQVLQVLESMRARLADLTPAMRSIGDIIKNASADNFKGQHGPDGTPWQPLKKSTLIARANRLSGGKGIYTKDGKRTTAKAYKIITTGKILRDTGVLANSVQIQSTSATSVSVGSRIVYAATHQYGAQSGAFGFGLFHTRNGSFPIPWGNIPARPFLGLNDAIKADILDTLRNYIGGATA